VWLTDEDIEKLAKHLQISRKVFLRDYTRKIRGKISLIEKENFDCVFFKDKKCSVYKARPKQCQTFPFWPQNISSRKDWEDAASDCEGIDHPDGDLISLGEIQKQLKK